VTGLWHKATPKAGRTCTILCTSRQPRPDSRTCVRHTGAEIPYASNTASPAWTDVDRALADAMSSYWVNFAKSGDPNGPGLPVWPAIGKGTSENVMFLGTKVEVGQMLDPQRVALFDSVVIGRSDAPRR
jgi:para-nitrobenzyl esterase